MDRDRLTELVERGLTVRQIAAEVGRSYSNVRHWLQRYGLKTLHRGPGRGAASGVTSTLRICKRHGQLEFVAVGARAELRCPRCRSEQVAARRRRVKAILVGEAGGSCRLCGYDRYNGALHFHHLDPSIKEFQLSLSGLTHSVARLRAEAAKCVLLCSNCHAEVEAGLATVDGPIPGGAIGSAADC